MSQNLIRKAAQVEQLTGYTFTNKLLPAEAVQMAAPQIAVVHENSFCSIANNKRLSLLGDAVLAKVLCDLWFNARNQNGNELTATDWTTLRNDLISNDSLIQRGHALGIDTIVHCNAGTIVSAKMVAATLQAIVGAVYQDGGDEAALRAVQHLGLAEHRFLTIPASLVPESTGRNSITSSYRKAVLLYHSDLRPHSPRGTQTQHRWDYEALSCRSTDMELLLPLDPGISGAALDYGRAQISRAVRRACVRLLTLISQNQGF